MPLWHRNKWQTKVTMPTKVALTKHIKMLPARIRDWPVRASSAGWRWWTTGAEGYPAQESCLNIRPAGRASSSLGARSAALSTEASRWRIRRAWALRLVEQGNQQQTPPALHNEHENRTRANMLDQKQERVS